MEQVALLAHPNPDLFFKAERLGDEIRVRQWNLDGLLLELSTRFDLKKGNGEVH